MRHLPKTVRSWVQSEALPPDQRGYRGAAKIDASIPYLRTRLAESCTNQSRLWREIREQGFTGTRALVAKWIHAHGQHTPVASAPVAPPLPAARQLAWLLIQAPERRSGADPGTGGTTPAAPRTHPRVQQLVQQGTAMIRQRQAANLEAWLQACRGSPSVALQNCAEGLQRDYAAVKAALTLPLVNRAGRRSHQPLEADQAQWIWPDEA